MWEARKAAAEQGANGLLKVTPADLVADPRIRAAFGDSPPGPDADLAVVFIYVGDPPVRPPVGEDDKSRRTGNGTR